MPLPGYSLSAMRTFILTAFVSLIVSVGVSAAPMELNLLDGTRIKGDVTKPASGSATDVVVITEFGVIRVPTSKLSTESRNELGLTQSGDSNVGERVAILENRVRQLEEENARLRRELAGARSAPSSAALTPVPQPRSMSSRQAISESSPASGGSYSKSSTGKRHNSGCRYYGSGQPCGPTDGVACKICGG